jgi:4-amino-4-deoxy-L-arabinose transferase-like glycosyltransferase
MMVLSEAQINSPLSHQTGGVAPAPDTEGFRPERSPAELAITALIGCTCLSFLALCRYTNLDADEGIVLQGAQRVLEGQVPYRDFFSFYVPGHYYSLALLFKLFGSSLFVARLELVICAVLFSSLTYLIARRTCARWSALLATYAAAVTCLPARFMVTHWDTTLVAYLALYCGIRWIEGQGPGWALATGSFMATSCLFEQSTGVGVCLGVILGAAIVWGRTRTPAFRLSLIGLAGIGFVWPFMFTIAYFGSRHALRAMITGSLWPLFHYSAANRTFYGYTAVFSHEAGIWHTGWIARIVLLVTNGPLFIISLLPLVAAGIFGWFALARPSRELSPRWQHFTFVSAFCLGLLISVLTTKRPDFVHLDYLAPIFYIVLAWAVQGLNLESRWWRSVVPFACFYLLISSTAFGLAMLAAPLGAHQQVATARGRVTLDDRDNSLEIAQRSVRPGEKILVYPYEPLYYYLTGTFSVTRHDFLQPGMHTPEQFQESLEALEANQTRVVLFDTSYKERLAWTSPNARMGVFNAHDSVSDYILAHYQKCEGPITNQYWSFLLMVRKDQPCGSKAQEYESTR